MRQLNFLLTAFVFVLSFAAQAATVSKRNNKNTDPNKNQIKISLHKANTQKGVRVTTSRTKKTTGSNQKLAAYDAPRVTGTIDKRPIVNIRNVSDSMTVTLRSKPPTANTGETSCPHKNKAFSPFSKEGKLTQVKRMLPNSPTALDTRASAGTL